MRIYNVYIYKKSHLFSLSGNQCSKRFSDLIPSTVSKYLLTLHQMSGSFQTLGQMTKINRSPVSQRWLRRERKSAW